jgi:hypothetical protein
MQPWGEASTSRFPEQWSLQLLLSNCHPQVAFGQEGVVSQLGNSRLASEKREGGLQQDSSFLVSTNTSVHGFANTTHLFLSCPWLNLALLGTRLETQCTMLGLGGSDMAYGLTLTTDSSMGCLH